MKKFMVIIGAICLIFVLASCNNVPAPVNDTPHISPEIQDDLVYRGEEFDVEDDLVWREGMEAEVVLL